MDPLPFALAAGMLAAVNPCGFAMLPAYLSMFILGESGDSVTRGGAARRALSATASMTLGFVVVFGSFGLVLTPVASTVQQWLPAVTIAIGAVLLALGLAMLAGRTPSLHIPFLRLTKDPVASNASMFLYGVAYAIASLGCTIGPFLVVTATTFRSGDTLTGIAAYAIYAGGMGLVVGVLALGAALASQSAASTLRRATPWLLRAAGAVLIVVGAYVAWYGGYEIRLNAGYVTSDPIIDAASQLQNRLAEAVDSIGATGFLVLLTGLVGLAWVAHVFARRRSSRDTVAIPSDERA